MEEKGADYRLNPLAPGTQKGPEHLARHPFGRIPVLDHGDFRLYETGAILRYLDRILPTPSLTPADARSAGLMDQALNINDWYLFQGVANVIAFQRVVGPRLMGLTPDESACAEAMPRARVVFAELSRLLGERPYFAGDAVSLADILIASHLGFMVETPEWAELGAPRTNLVEWLQRMDGRPSIQATTWPAVAEMARAA